MPPPGPRTAPIAMAGPSKPRLPDTVTEAGHFVDQFSAVQRAIGLEAAVAATVRTHPPAPTRLSRAQAREAHQQAVLGVRLAQRGRHAQAIPPLRRSVTLDPTVATTQHDLGLACLAVGRHAEAAQAFAHAVRLDPTLASGHNNLAVALDHLGRGGEALAAYQAAVRLEPQRHMAQFRIGQIQLGRGNRAEAAAVFRAAAAAVPGTTQALINEACAADAAGDTAAAQALLRALIDDAPACGMAYLLLGQMLAQSGQSTEAAACLERGIALEPGMMTAWQGFATNTKFTAADQPLIERIGACLAQPDLTPAQTRAIHFALGKAYDDTGDYAAAMRHFDAANQIRRTAATLDRETLARQTGRVIATTPAGYLDRRPDLGVADETPILIVGMPRSGTTLVEQILSSHPDVAAGGELSFWHDRNRAGVGVFGADARTDVVRRLADDYLAVLRGFSPTAPRVTDKMPFNFGLLGVIRQVFPRAAIVHCRRHPIDTCLSIFATDFEATIDFAADRGSLVFFYDQYQRLMAHWRAVLPAERFIEIDYEALVADPEPLTRRLVAACGLAWDDACLAPQRNQRRIATASVWQARQPIYRTSVERWRRYEPWIGELRQLLDPGTL